MKIIRVLVIIFIFFIQNGYSNALQNIPDVSFELSPQQFGNLATYQVALADLDGDTDLDAVFSNYNNPATTIYFNDGNGQFVISAQSLPITNGHGVGLGDLDGDDDIDIFMTSANGYTRSKIFFNDGNGAFTESTQQLNDKSWSSNGISLLDIDGDNDLDALVDYYQLPNKVYENDGNGLFIDNNQSYRDHSFFSDIDSDGDEDILQVDLINKGYRIWKNDGTGSFTSHSFTIDSSVITSSVSFGDLDNDDDLDAIITSADLALSKQAKILLNDGTGIFSESSIDLVETLIGMSIIGDLNNDSHTDFILSTYEKLNQLYVSDGNGHFNLSEFGNSTDILSAGPVLGDLDNDGLLDLILPNFFTGSPRIWFNRTELSCCGIFVEGYAGNTNCSADGKRNLADITALIDKVYLSKNPLCCDENGNVDGDLQGKTNLSDITRLIDHVFLSKLETSPCS